MLPERAPDVCFDVLGDPAPQGSKKHVGGGRLVESSKRVRPWRQIVAWAASRARCGRPTLTGPVVVAIEFYKPRPAGHPKTRRTLPTSVTGDIDKLIRSTLDALTTSGVFADDSLVVDAQVRQRYATDNARIALPWEPVLPGARIAVWEITVQDTWDEQPLIAFGQSVEATP